MQAVLGEVVLVFYLFAVTYLRPYMARADNLRAMGSLFGKLARSSPPVYPI